MIRAPPGVHHGRPLGYSELTYMGVMGQAQQLEGNKYLLLSLQQIGVQMDLIW